MNKLQSHAGASSGGAVVAGESSLFPTTDTTMIKIPRPKFTMNSMNQINGNGNHKGDSVSGGSVASSLFQQLAASSSSASNTGASLSSQYPYQEPPVDYWSANNSNSSSNTDLRSITKQLDKDFKI